MALKVQITGYLPVLASDGKAGVEKANQNKPDLILMDMMMSGMVGRRRGAPSSRETKDIPILATTALVRAEDLKSCLDVGCNGYIIKLVNGVDLQRKTRNLLATKELPA